jgi:methylmalonyl-CoA mutase C-terminal domain/subunit
MDNKSVRVMIAKAGMDGHDRGAIIVTMGLRDEGMEVIYTGLRQTAESIVRTCVQEDVDVLGLSSLSGGHSHYLSRVTELLHENGMDHVLVIAGGIIPREDIPSLKESGVSEVFGPGTKVKDIAAFIREHVKAR